MRSQSVSGYTGAKTIEEIARTFRVNPRTVKRALKKKNREKITNDQTKILSPQGRED